MFACFYSRNLTSLDLSYNMVNNLSGLKSLHGPGFSLTFLYLHGNQLRSLDHVINCTVGCHNLKELSLSRYGESNPVCENVGYRTKVLAALKMLDVLDGLDRFGNLSATKGGLFSFPGMIVVFERKVKVMLKHPWCTFITAAKKGGGGGGGGRQSYIIVIGLAGTHVWYSDGWPKLETSAFECCMLIYLVDLVVDNLL